MKYLSIKKKKKGEQKEDGDEMGMRWDEMRWDEMRWDERRHFCGEEKTINLLVVSKPH